MPATYTVQSYIHIQNSRTEQKSANIIGQYY